MRILSIETSCDETGVSVLEASGEAGSDFRCRVLGNALMSQTETHAPYGGVFPNLARREHEKNLIPLLSSALSQAELLEESGVRPLAAQAKILEILSREQQLQTPLLGFLSAHEAPKLDAIAVTFGPGLEPALWVGVNVARALATAWQLPLIPVHHMEGHLIASLVEWQGDSCTMRPLEYPLVALLVSGGHTELLASRSWMQYEKLGATRDDAAGEAFDKIARLLGLPYPGGPALSELARAARERGEELPFRLPRPMMGDGLDFSFAGLKTAIRRKLDEEGTLSQERVRLYARETEEAIVDVLVSKTLRAVGEIGASAVLLGGGVSANQHVRARLTDVLQDSGAELFVCPPELSTDNAIMIGLAGYFRALKSRSIAPEALRAVGRPVLESA